MIEIRINREIGNFEPKFIGPFTIRQTICIGIAAPICYYIYNAAAPYMTVDLAGFLCAFPAGIAALFGWVKPYGMKMERFIKAVFINMVIAPANRKYCTVNQHERGLKALNDVLKELEVESKRKNRWKSSKKPRYRVSEEAVR